MIYTCHLTWRQKKRLHHLANATLIVYNHLLLFGFRWWKKQHELPSQEVLEKELKLIFMRHQSWLTDIPIGMFQNEMAKSYEELASYVKTHPTTKNPPRIKQGKERTLDIQPICRYYGNVMVVETLGAFYLHRNLKEPVRSVSLYWNLGPTITLTIEEAP